MPEDKRARQDRVTRQNTERAILAIIATYYPSPLREKTLRCCLAQRAGHYRRTCRSPLCPACCPKESHKVYLAQYARFQACTPPHKKGRPRLAHEVYTLPPHLRGHLLRPGGYNAWAKATREAIREIHQADVAGVMNLHPIGEQDLTTFHPHWDVVINGHLLDNGRPREHRAPHIYFDDARAIYVRHLTRELKLSEREVPHAVSIYLDRKEGRTFHTRERKTRHMVRYSSRHVYQPQWSHLMEHGTGVDWWYRPERDPASVRRYEGSEVIRNLLTIQEALHGKKRRIWFGYMQNRLFPASAAAFHAFRVPGGDA